MAYVQKRGEGRYKVRIYVRGEGKRWLPGVFPTEEEARAAGEEAERTATRKGETVGEFAQRWVKDYPRSKGSTQDYYISATNRIASDTEPVNGVVLKDLPLTEVTRPIARAYCMRRRSLHQTLSAMFTDAMNDGLVNGNPFHRLNLPTSRGRKNIAPLTRDEVELLAETALEVWPGRMGLTLRGLVMFAAFVGCRPGEAFAVRRAWLHYASEEVEINARLYEGIEALPKNGETRRVVFPSLCHEAVRAVPANAQDDRVFTTERGRPFTKSQFYRYWHPVRTAFQAKLPDHRRERLAEARGKPNLDFYELRHFCASYLLDRGLTPEDVAHQLGHTDGGQLVRELYGHPDQDLRRARIKAAFNGGTK